MQNPFNHENYPSNELKRNTFPCSFQNNLTMKYGYIYPAGVWRTVPGATYKIQPTLGLNFMPTTFPVQTRQKVYVHYFYGRDRNFWKDYKDFINGQRPDLVKPYIDESVTQARTGKLLDYLGVPTTIVGKYGNVSSTETYLYDDDRLLSIPNFFPTVASALSDTPTTVSSLIDSLDGLINTEFKPSRAASNNVNDLICIPFSFSETSQREVLVHSESTGTVYDFSAPMSETHQGSPYFGPIPRSANILGSYCRFIITNSDDVVTNIISPSEITNDLKFRIDGSFSKCYFVFPYASSTTYGQYGSSYQRYTINYHYLDSNHSLKFVINSFNSGIQDINSITSPYWCSNDTRDKETIKLNAYLPRFYETVYNLYYRNPQNNPYILNGRPEYNKFIPSKDGGVDSNLYELRRRNWEDDFLTTAVQSPQQGIAPLVGLTDRGVTLTLTNEDGTVTRYNVTTTDNGSITGIEANDTSAEPVLTKALIDAVSYGISIEDIRNVNAMQKWLELNLRKGYQYKDIIQARWGISISYNELDLPEFIGGFSKDVQLQAVTQTANVNDDVTGQLGWQAGRLYAEGQGREITHYCDEEGYIMCLITVVPVPNYSQLLPKHWFERDLLDSYQPEFNHIGFQPITYKEVCPVQAFQESTENVNVLEQTFGYQRPWYQYFNYTDEVHGQFRTTFKDFLINRVFDVKPELSESFLLVDPEQINDVFNVPDVDDDKIIGAIYHNCVAKLPISLYAQARLE